MARETTPIVSHVDTSDQSDDHGILPVTPPALAPVADPVPPTLAEAFTCLCQAMDPYLEESLPDQTHCQEIQGWYANGNHLISWAHAVQLLEQVLGQKLLP
jgi:hypothetical protein